MAWTQSDVDKLKAAIASGAKKVQYKDRTIEYQDTTQMQRALASMVEEVNATAGKPNRTRISTRKGFDRC